MCGRFSLTSSPEATTQHFGIEGPVSLEPRYNIAPSQNIPAITADKEPVMLRWGLIPSWTKDPPIGNKMINARTETASEKPSFRSAYRSRRCLFPADGIYEWKRDEAGKRPYHIRKVDRGLFCFSGLWEEWSKGEETIRSCTIIITEANELLKLVHHRMPVTIQEGNRDFWLIGEDAALLLPYDWSGLVAVQVSTYVNNPRHEG